MKTNSTLLATTILGLACLLASSPASAAKPRPRPLAPLAAKMEPTRKVVYKTVDDRSLTLHIFEPEGHQTTDRRPVFLTIHGGGWTGMKPRYFYPFAKHFADLGMVGISVQYRLCNPKQGVTVFDCVKDARSAVRYVRSHAAELGIDPERIVVSGGSAGGHLAASTALFDGMDQEGDDTSVSCMPNLMVLYYPVIDTSKDGYGQAKIGERWQDLSPVDHVKPELPPTLLLHGTADTVTPFAGAALFRERMKKAGNEIEMIAHGGGVHGYFIFDLKLFAQAMEQTETFLQECGFMDQPELPFTIEQTVATQGFDEKMCWVHARAGAIPAADGTDPTVVMTLQKLQLSGSDIFYALNEMRTTDGGNTWSQPVQHESFARVPFAFDDHDDLEITVCDFWPKWHSKTDKLLGTGHTVVYENNRVRHVRPRGTAYAVYDAENATWSPWKTIEMPADAKFGNAGAGCTQRFDLPDGQILLPVYFAEIGKTQFATTVLRCGFDGKTIRYLEHGSELTVPVKRGLYEPSVTEFGGRYYLTMRNDDHGYISVSEGNGSLKFSEPKKWTFDDGADLGNYNTQQHWVRHPKHGLWLVYTRRGAGNDHVFRHRAPLFIAKVDLEKLHVIRATERIVVPEKGARLGNFGVTQISDDETWVTAAEWMQAPAPNHHDPKPLIARGADNRVWVTKLKWGSGTP